MLCAVISAAFAERTVTMSLQGTLKEGTTSSTTYHPDGSVSLSATCDFSYMECARATVTVSGLATTPSVGDPTVFQTFDPKGTVLETFHGRYVTDRKIEKGEETTYEFVLTDFEPR